MLHRSAGKLETRLSHTLQDSHRNGSFDSSRAVVSERSGSQQEMAVRQQSPHRFLHKHLQFLHRRCPPLPVPAAVHTLLALAMQHCRRARCSLSQISAADGWF